MKFKEEDYMYLEGKKFSNGYNIKLGNNPLYSRIEALLKIVEGGNVLHIGCCDHIDLIANKIQNHTWLQQLLDERCTNVYGVDINQEAVDYVNSNKLAKHNVICADMTSSDLSDVFNKVKFDYILLGEILEHVDNPVAFLESMRKNCSKYGFSGKYVITVPNAFCFQRSIYLKGIEGINTDHRYWFTPYTAAKVLSQAGIHPDEVVFTDYVTGMNGINKFTNCFFRMYYLLRKKPSSYKSYRGGQMIIIGKNGYEEC